MSKPQTGTSGAADAGWKEKASPLDDDLDTEFGSWKSMSANKDDTMDFNLDEIPKGKKNAFKFDNLDMDFNIGGDFDKMSSFKDMDDFDFSSPVKKNTKPKDKAQEESSSGKIQGKPSSCKFSFDFNELDDFNFGPSLTEGEKKSKSSESQNTVSDVTDIQGCRIDDGKLTKPPQSKLSINSKEENMISNTRVADRVRDNPQQKCSTLDDLAVSRGARNTFEKTTIRRAQETSPQSQPAKKIISTESSHQPAEKIIASREDTTPLYSQRSNLDCPVESLSEKSSAQDTITNLQAEVGHLNTRLNTGSDGGGNVDTRMVSDLVPNHETLNRKSTSPMRLKEPLSHNDEINKLPCNANIPVECTSNSETDRGDTNLEDISSTRVSGKSLHDVSSIREHHNLTSKLLSNTLSTSSMLGKLTTPKEKDNGVVRSRFFKTAEETESQLLPGSSSYQKKNTLPEKKVNFQMQSYLEEHKREKANANPAQMENIMAGDSSSPAGGSTLEKTLVSGNGKNHANNTNISSHVNPTSSTEQETKSVDLKVKAPSMASIRKTLSVERNPFPSIKAGSKTPDLSSLKISGLMGAKSGLLNSSFRKEPKSVTTLKVSPKVYESPLSKMVHSTDTKKQTLLSPSLKRKTSEAPNTDFVTLYPQKRFSESPRDEIRVNEVLKSVQQQGSKLENMVSSSIKSPVCDPLASTTDFPRELDMTEIEIPLVMETDVNVEKAEAYGKELDDICNMLKKKHEEAKELLVRAVVNNNNLLMLNHPIFEEKIRAVQKLAERLMQKEIETDMPRLCL